jgi:glutamine amidotransferase
VVAKKHVAVIDYGFGNVRSVLNAIEKAGLEPRIVSTAGEVERSSSIVLPGVGAFATAMRVISHRGLDDAIREAVSSGSSILGICLGMQLLFEKSLEFGQQVGLGIFEGTVGPLVPQETVSPEAKSTHISWAKVAPCNSGRLAG